MLSLPMLALVCYFRAFSIKIWYGDPDTDGTLIHSSHNDLAGGNIIVRTK